VSIADKELRGANVTRGIVPIRFNERVLNQYYGYFQIVSSLIQEQIKAGTYGAALMQINIRDLRKIEFIVPTMDRQSECVEIFEELESKTDTLILEYAQKLQDLDDLRQSLLQKAFAGELT
jgi:type I restriction enzyme S subunit